MELPLINQIFIPYQFQSIKTENLFTFFPTSQGEKESEINFLDNKGDFRANRSLIRPPNRHLRHLTLHPPLSNFAWGEATPRNGYR